MTQLVNVNEMSPAQLDFLQKQIMAKQNEMLRKEMEQVKDELAKIRAEREMEKQDLETVKHRVNNFDLINVEGDPQQRLNRMIRKYAAQQGVTHSTAWKHFRQNYNTAYRTNLTSLMEHYKERNGVHHITAPEFLKETGHIEDAIRVADKMINGQVTA